jgi:pimeloyl-ACP methyl ester carboxylesterase
LRAVTTSNASRIPAIFLPGIVMPAQIRYRRLFEALGDDVDAVAKDLEVYRGPVPPPGYAFEMEIEGIGRAADEHGFDRFHLYGHSGGGACTLAFTTVHPERVLTLALDEPASDFSQEDREELRQVFLPMLDLPPDQQMSTFLRAQLRDGVELPSPPPGRPPPWLADAPAAVRAFVVALSQAEVPIERLRTFDRPVYYSYNDLSNETWERKAKRLDELFSNITIELYEGLHHLNTSHAAEPERVAAALRRLWSTTPKGVPS